jgi:TonB-dependent starch-binding outer membrane protein SusC
LGYLGKNISSNYLDIFNELYDTAIIIYHGSAIPTSFGFINNSFSYKGITLAMSLSYRFGYYFRKSAISYFNLYDQGIPHGDYADRWKQPGDEKLTTIPSATYPISDDSRDQFYQQSSANVYKGDNIRLQYIKISYDLDRKRFPRLPFRTIQLYGTMENIGVIWSANDQGLDPDINAGNSPYPLPLKVAVGIKFDL